MIYVYKIPRHALDRAITIAGLQEKLLNVQTELVSLSDYKKYEDDINELAVLNPSDLLLSGFSGNVRQLIQTEINTLLESGNRSDAESLAAEYGALLSTLQLGPELSRIKLAHLSGDALTEAIQNIVAGNKSTIEELLAEPKINDANWQSSLLANVQEMENLVREDQRIASELDPLRDAVAKLYVDEAKRILAAERFDAANDIIEQGARYAPNNFAINETRNAINNARTEYERELRVTSLKEGFEVQTDANQVAEATKTFEQLKADLPADDPYISLQAPSLLAKSYANLAQGQYDSDNYDSALKLADARFEVRP